MQNAFKMSSFLGFENSLLSFTAIAIDNQNYFVIYDNQLSQGEVKYVIAGLTSVDNLGKFVPVHWMKRRVYRQLL